MLITVRRGPPPQRNRIAQIPVIDADLRGEIEHVTGMVQTSTNMGLPGSGQFSDSAV